MRLRSLMAGGCLVALVLGAGSPAVAADEALNRGSFWYAIDNVLKIESESRILMWAVLPPTRPEQDVTVLAIEPEPVAVLEDPASGIRVVEWLLEPEAWTVLPEQEARQFFFHFEFEYRTNQVRLEIDPDALDAYDRDDPIYRRHTLPELGIQTDGDIYDLARSIVGDERNPLRRGRLLNDWVTENMSFVAGGVGDRDARSILAGRRGDCGQFSTLYVALCRSIGIPARTVDRVWITGGKHTIAEIHMPGQGWLPVDTSLGQMLLPGDGNLPPAKAAAARTTYEAAAGRPGWFYGNLAGDSFTVSVGNNVRVTSPTLGRVIDFRRLHPGGRDAEPAAINIEGFNASIIHGGFFVFDHEVAGEAAAHALTHQRLGNLFFNTDLYEPVEEGCLQPMRTFAEGVHAWLNQGKVYMHKGEYYKAEAAFKRALRAADFQADDVRDAVVWIHNYLGNCYDLLGKRDLAVESYRRAADMDINYRGAMKYAQRYLEKPFSKQPPVAD